MNRTLVRRHLGAIALLACGLAAPLRAHRVLLAGQQSTSLTEQGISFFKQRKYAEAKAVLTKALAANPQDATAKAYFGMSLYNYDHDADRACEQLEGAVQLDPGRSQFHQWLGAVYGGKAQSGSLLKAPYYAGKCRQEFEKGVELDPRDSDARESLMQFYLMAPGIAGGSEAKAREQASALSKLDPYRGLLAEGRIAEYRKDDGKAEACYRQAIAQAPGKGEAYNGLGYVLLRKKQMSEALDTFKNYVQAVPREPNAHDSLAESLLVMGRVDESLAEYQKALELDPGFLPSCMGLGACHERKGQWRQAREAYQRCIEIQPKGHYASQARKKLQEIQNKG